ncbi:hypothetical protein ABFS83_14G037800 [Erythranthe nasuta]
MEEQQTAKKKCVQIANELPVASGDFTDQDSGDDSFTSKGVDDFSEWYADWPQLQTLLRNHLSFPPSAPPPAELSVLVPACGNSRLSEHLYDDGFKNITNVDFSKVVVSAMLRRNVEERPLMKWRVMDMTNIQFANGTFDAIVDKGGLDALVESELGLRSGILYISEVKRLLKAGGRYICLTLAKSHVLGLLFSKFRFGWKTNLYSIAHEASSGTTKQQTYMLVAEKSILTVVSQIVSSDNQDHELFEALERENTVRAEYFNGTDTWYSLEDLKLGVKGNIRKLEPGRHVKLFLGETGVSRFFYTGVLLDAIPETEPFSDRFRVVFLKKTQSSQKIIAAESRQWRILGRLKAARLLMIVLDSSHSNVTWDDIMRDIYYFVNQLAPVEIGDDIDIVATSEDDMIDGIKQRILVHQVLSILTGPIFVEDVIYDHDLAKDLIFRRLCFERTENLVHSGAPLSIEGPNEISASSGQPKVEHKILVTGFHKGVIAGLLLFSLHSERTTSAGVLVKTVIIGLGSGILPMFMRNCLPSLQIEVVELDPVVLNVASEYFGFIEDESLKVHITDATKFVRERANSEEEGNDSSKVDVLIIDVGSSDSSSGLISPEADFVEESFLLTVKDSLSDNGLFVFKLISKYSSVRGAVYSKLRKVFSNLYHFYADGDFVEIIFALKKDSPIIAENELAEACEALARSLQHNNQDWAKRVLHNSILIKPLP